MNNNFDEWVHAKRIRDAIHMYHFAKARGVSSLALAALRQALFLKVLEKNTKDKTMNDKPKIIDFQHTFHRTPFTRVPMCYSPVGYIVLRDNTFEIICASGHVAVWRRFETNDIASQVAKATSDIYHVSLRDESEGVA